MTRIVNLRCEDLKEHPAAKIVPEMRPDEWEAFLDDVRQRGVIEPVVVSKTRVLDGRHRLRANKQLHVELIPARQVEMTDAEQLDYLIRAALLRRHLDESQRAMLAARLKPHFAAAAKDRKEQNLRQNQGSTERDNCPLRSEGKASDQAGKSLGVSGKSVQRAEKVIEKAVPKIAEMVDAGEVSVAAAAVVADLPKREQTAVAKAGPSAVKEKAVEMRREAVEDETPVRKMFADLLEHVRQSVLLIDKIHNATGKKHGQLHESVMNSLDIAGQDAQKWRRLCK